MTSNLWPEALPRPGNMRYEQISSVSPWFTIYKIADGVFALLEPNHDEEVFSYLVLGSEFAVLIDTGMGIDNIKKEVENITELPVLVINTHGHFDHIGDNHRFGEVWCYDEEFDISNIEKGFTHSEIKHYMRENSYMNLPPGFEPSQYAIKPSVVTRRLQHLDTIDLGGRSLQIHHTPGHSPGSICILEDRDEILFTGDTLYPGTLIAHLKGSNFSAYLHSFQYMSSLMDQINLICPSHNEAYMPLEKIDDALNAFELINADQAKFEIKGESKIYTFDGFRVRLPLD